MESTSISSAGDHTSSYNPSILIIAAVIAAAVVVIASVHLLLRVISGSRSRPIAHHPSPDSIRSPPSDRDPKDPTALISSLPLFSLSSSAAKRPTSSLDCAVCLSPFEVSDELRLLPSCRHAFHSHCIDTWLRSNLTCPLCRSPIAPVPVPPPQPAAESRSESFRVEIGSVSRRTDDSSRASHARSYTLGSSFEYVVEDEDIEAVLARLRRSSAAEKADPSAPGDAVADIAGGSHRSWLRDYIDRLASSASSSFSSLRFSQRWSSRFDSAAVSGVADGGERWDLERDLNVQLEEVDGVFSAICRWIGA